MFITTVRGMIIIMIRMMIMMIIRHRWHQAEVRIQQRPSAGVSFVTSRIARSKNRPRQSDLIRRENEDFGKGEEIYSDLEMGWG